MSKITEQRILAIDPTNRGFGYAVLEGPQSLLDWGVTGTRAKTIGALAQHAEKLIEVYEPDVLVIEDYGLTIARQRRRARAFLRAVEKLANGKRIRLRALSRTAVRSTFANVRPRNKDQIALLLATCYPELLPWLPKVRKIWMPEEYRMNIFDAVALAVTFFNQQKRKRASLVEKPAITRVTLKAWTTTRNEIPTTSPRP